MEYKLNDIINVTIKKIMPYGVIVTIDGDNIYTGMIHISEISSSYIKNINAYFKSDKLRAQIIGIDKDKKHLNLSMKNINKNPHKNNLKEEGTGFIKLEENLPKWIEETSKVVNKKEK